MKHPALAKLERGGACCMCGTPHPSPVTGADVFAAGELVQLELAGDTYRFPICGAWCAYLLGHRTHPIVVQLTGKVLQIT